MKNKNKKPTLINSNKKSNYALLIAIITFVIFANCFKNGYNMDDNLVTQNHPLTSNGLSTVKEIFTRSYYKDAMGNTFGYRPMVHLSFAIEDAFFGESAAISHFINVLLYVFAVFLFYKLVLVWLGEQKKTIALLAALFFALHPIHSEVVSSIKNRDEILAFIFAILSALAINEFVNNKKWTKLFLVGIYFSLGMLAKKSIFPLALIFPIAQFFLQRPSLKEMVKIALVLLIPTAIIGGEGDWFKSCLIFGVPAICIFSLMGMYHLLEKKALLASFWRQIMEHRVLLLSILAWGFVSIGIVTLNFLFISLAAILFSIVFYKNSTSGFIQIIVLTFVLTFQNQDVEFLDYALFFGMYFTLFEKDKLRKNYLIALIIGALVLYFYLAIRLDFNFQNYSVLIEKIVIMLILFGLFRFKRIYGILFGLMQLFLFAFFGWYIAFITVALFLVVNTVKKVKEISKFEIPLPAISFFVITLYSCFFGLKLIDTVNLKVPNETIKYTANLSKLNTGIKEGRSLEYVENTLVAPHSKSETIGSGFLVLGEYARLMLYPQELSFYYGFSKIKTTSLNSFVVWISIFFYLGLIALALYNIKKFPIISIGIFWYIASILLFSNWIELVAGMVGERLAFTASAGFCILIASLLFRIKPTFNFLKPQKLEILVLVVLLLFSGRSMCRNLDWKSPVILMSKDIDHLDNSAQANNMLAMSLMDESLKNPDLSQETVLEYRKKAIFHFQKAIKIFPYFFNYNFDLGRSYIALNDNVNAKKAYLKAYNLLPNNPLVLEELTKTCFDLGQKEDTEFYGNKYLAMNPNNENINELVAYICLLNKDFIKANSYAKRGLKYFPNNPNLNKMVIDSQKFQ